MCGATCCSFTNHNSTLPQSTRVRSNRFCHAVGRARVPSIHACAEQPITKGIVHCNQIPQSTRVRSNLSLIHEKIFLFPSIHACAEQPLFRKLSVIIFSTHAQLLLHPVRNLPVHSRLMCRCEYYRHSVSMRIIIG